MDENKRKLVILDLVLVLILLALFGLAPPTFYCRHADSDLIQAGCDVASGNDVRTSPIPLSGTLLSHHVLMKTTNGSTPLQQ